MVGKWPFFGLFMVFAEHLQGGGILGGGSFLGGLGHLKPTRCSFSMSYLLTGRRGSWGPSRSPGGGGRRGVPASPLAGSDEGGGGSDTGRAGPVRRIPARGELLRPGGAVVPAPWVSVCAARGVEFTTRLCVCVCVRVLCAVCGCGCVQCAMCVRLCVYCVQAFF